ncbi:MAG TPA: ABC transporter substrate-binding protein, partial [Luteitalea sp.]|nr:ABC transporter substrate-binding protein [Luteitalea sp.]
ASDSASPPRFRDVRLGAARRAAVCLGAATALTTACSREPVRHGKAPAPTTVTVAFPSPDAPVDPLIYNLTSTRLIRMDQAGHERPELLERWQPSADRLTWTLTLRDGVRLHDGTIATASEVARRIKDAIDSGDSQPGLWTVQSAAANGPTSVVLTLREPTSLLLEGLSLVEALPAGPYREVDEDAALPELMAADGPPPRPDVGRVTVRRYDTPRAAVAALLREDVDVLYEVPSDARALLSSEDSVQTFPYVKPYVVTLGLNHRHPALAKREVRQALNAAVDRKAIVEEDADGFGEPAADLLWREHWAVSHTADVEAMRPDRDRARRLLDEAGLRERTRTDGSVEPRLRLTCLIVDDPTMRRVAARLQRTYASIGIALDLQVLPLREMLPRLGTGTFDTFLTPVVTGYGLGMPYLYFADHRHPRLFSHGYTGAAAAAERVRQAATDDAFADAARELHRVLLEDPPAVYLYWLESSRAVGPRLRVPSPVEGDVLGSLSRWTVAGAAR